MNDYRQTTKPPQPIAACTQTKLVDPWQIARDIASWLPFRDERRAMRIIEHHERRHREAGRLES